MAVRRNEVPEGREELHNRNKVVVIDEVAGEAAAQPEPRVFVAAVYPIGLDCVHRFIVDSDDEGFGDDDESRLEVRGAWAQDALGHAQPCHLCAVVRHSEVLTTIRCPQCFNWYCAHECFIRHIRIINTMTYGVCPQLGHSMTILRQDRPLV